MSVQSPPINAHLHVMRFLQTHSPDFATNDFPSLYSTDNIPHIMSHSSPRRARTHRNDTNTVLRKVRSQKHRVNINLGVDISAEVNKSSITNIDNSKLIHQSRNYIMHSASPTHSGSEHFIKSKQIQEYFTPQKYIQDHPPFNSGAIRFKTMLVTDIPPIGNYNPVKVPLDQYKYSFGHSLRPQIINQSKDPYKLILNPIMPSKHIPIPNIEKVIARKKEIQKHQYPYSTQSSLFDLTHELKRLQDLVSKYTPSYEELKVLALRAKQVRGIVMRVNAAPRASEKKPLQRID